ncbi:hypothetical protein OLV26 [Organic Lake virophage]|nr:hypothetical protein OLV26 [Organic Lake virophage]
MSVVLYTTYRLSLVLTSIGIGLGFWVVMTVLAIFAILYGLTFLGLTVMVSSVINDLIFPSKSNVFLPSHSFRFTNNFLQNPSAWSPKKSVGLDEVI